MSSFDISLLRTILETETDADSLVSEELMSQIRENWEALLMLMLSTGVTGAADSDPPNDTTGVLTDASPGFTVDDHNGRTLLITSGLAIGNLYTIDDTTTTTLICTGDNLYSDGVRQADTYLILYDVKNNTDGHNHNSINSPYVTLPAGMVMLPPIAPTDEASFYVYSKSGTYETVVTYHIYIRPEWETLYGIAQVYVDFQDGSDYVRWRMTIGGDNSAYYENTGQTSTWGSCSLDISALSGWYDLEIQMTCGNAEYGRMEGYSFYIG